LENLLAGSNGLYEFSLDEMIPTEHLLQRINVFATAVLADWAFCNTVCRKRTFHNPAIVETVHGSKLTFAK
jgi:hypothetical protein